MHSDIVSVTWPDFNSLLLKARPTYEKILLFPPSHAERFDHIFSCSSCREPSNDNILCKLNPLVHYRVKSSAKGKPDVQKRADKPSEYIFIETDRGLDAALIHKVFSFLHRMIGFSNI